jgi:hypothetical protein
MRGVNSVMVFREQGLRNSVKSNLTAETERRRENPYYFQYAFLRVSAVDYDLYELITP